MTTHGWVTPVAADGKGFPDLVMVHAASGKLVVAELKVGAALPTDEQMDWLEGFATVEGAIVKLWVWPEDWQDVRKTLSHGRMR